MLKAKFHALVRPLLRVGLSSPARIVLTKSRQDWTGPDVAHRRAPLNVER